MDDDRKYRQHGYMDSKGESNGTRQDRPKQNGPKPPIDITGPRLPRLLQSVAAARCFSCSTALPSGIDWKSVCPKCGTALHCCKQCAHFDTSTRFQCLKPVAVRVAVKDQANGCELFKPRVTVARDAAPQGPVAAAQAHAPRTPTDARAAFDNLFKK